MVADAITAVPIGSLRSTLKEREQAPRQGPEGAPDAWLVIDPNLAEGLASIERGAELVVLTWLHLANRTVLSVHPRDDQAASLAGVFATRSADRPNPIGLHRVRVRERTDCRLLVGPLEAVDGTPILDIKPVWGSS